MKPLIRWIHGDLLTPPQAQTYSSLPLSVLNGLHNNRQIRITLLHGIPRVSRGSIDRLLQASIATGRPIFYGNPLNRTPKKVRA